MLLTDGKGSEAPIDSAVAILLDTTRAESARCERQMSALEAMSAQLNGLPGYFCRDHRLKLCISLAEAVHQLMAALQRKRATRLPAQRTRDFRERAQPIEINRTVNEALEAFPRLWRCTNQKI